jgi:S-adenosylmethionine hydrolase
LRFITLLTDFGLQDGYPGIMKGVIWGIAPHVKIADITHTIRPQNVLEGAQVLGRAVPYFPPATIHIAVVDPGVGTRRRPIAAQLGDQYFVGPDNGLFTRLLERAREQDSIVQVVHLTQPRYWLADISNVFHGRDIFAPVGAHLANGVALADLGSPIADPLLLEIPRPQRTPQGWRGKVILVDNFGNLSTNIERTHLQGLTHIRVRIAGQEIVGLVNTFGDAPVGKLAAMLGEIGELTIAIPHGSAALELQAGVGTDVEVQVEA